MCYHRDPIISINISLKNVTLVENIIKDATKACANTCNITAKHSANFGKACSLENNETAKAFAHPATWVVTSASCFADNHSSSGLCTYTTLTRNGVQMLSSLM